MFFIKNTYNAQKKKGTFTRNSILFQCMHMGGGTFSKCNNTSYALSPSLSSSLLTSIWNTTNTRSVTLSPKYSMHHTLIRFL
mmetsp:Transcript_27720/g.41243  ORF Transcript_27720/g.41243 Transcript_27720/m.41243 type:complete len:82 (+) Transcript_27720:304-549(+)